MTASFLQLLLLSIPIGIGLAIGVIFVALTFSLLGQLLDLLLKTNRRHPTPPPPSTPLSP